MSEGLKSALEALYEERAAINDQLVSLRDRLTLVDKGIAALIPLVPNAGLDDLVEDEGGAPLWRHIQDAIEAMGPSRPREIAEFIRASGYVTSSKDFPNVVGTNLRAYPNRFEKLSDGNWQNVGDL